MPELVELERRSAIHRTVAWIAVLGVTHFALGTRTHAVHGLHVLLAGLFLIPVLTATTALGTRGGLLAAFAAGLVYTAHLLWSWRDSPMANADQYGMVGVYFEVAIAAGRLVAIADWRKQQRDEVIRREYERTTRDGGRAA